MNKKILLSFFVFLAVLMLGLLFNRLKISGEVAKIKSNSLLCDKVVDCVPTRGTLPKGVCAPGGKCS